MQINLYFIFDILFLIWIKLHRTLNNTNDIDNTKYSTLKSNSEQRAWQNRNNQIKKLGFIKRQKVPNSEKAVNSRLIMNSSGLIDRNNDTKKIHYPIKNCASFNIECKCSTETNSSVALRHKTHFSIEFQFSIYPNRIQQISNLNIQTAVKFSHNSKWRGVN